MRSNNNKDDGNKNHITYNLDYDSLLIPQFDLNNQCQFYQLLKQLTIGGNNKIRKTKRLHILLFGISIGISH